MVSNKAVLVAKLGSLVKDIGSGKWVPIAPLRNVGIHSKMNVYIDTFITN